MSTGVGMWARRELAARWRSLVVLGLLAGVAGGLALAAVAGARRTGTAYERFRTATAAPDAIVFGTQLGIFDADYSKVRELPEVLSAGAFALAAVGIEKPYIGSLPPDDDQLYRTLARPLLVDGRLPDPDRDDELVVNRAAADRYDLHVGQKLTIVSGTELDENAPHDGPTSRATIVGIGDGMMDLIFQGDEPAIVPSGAFLTQHPEIQRAPNLVVRLRPGTDVVEFRKHAASALGLPDIPVRDLAEDTKRVTHATDLEESGLLLFALAALLAGVVLVGQALARTVYGMAETAPTLRALGLTRRGLLTGLVLPFGIAAATALIAGLVTAVALSSVFPIGLAGRLDPTRGLQFDVLVLVPGAVFLAIGVLVLALAASLRATGKRALVDTSRGSALLRAIRAVTPTSVSIGAGLALERGRGPRSLPVRPALSAAVAALLGVVACLGLVRGIDDATADPARSGQIWDALVVPNEEGATATLVADLQRDRDVVGVDEIERVPLDVSGAGLPVYSVRGLGHHASFVVLDGRAPGAVDEAVLGPETASALGRDIGDRVKVNGHTARVVGLGLFLQTPHSSYDQGVWMTPRGLRRAAAGTRSDQGPTNNELGVRFRDGVDVGAATTRLGSKLGVEAETASIPQDVENLRNVRGLPRWLAAFFALLGIAAVGHVLVTAVRRRRNDLAVLRALGFRPRQAAATISWQAMTVGAVGLVVGIPLGIAAGRFVWRLVADSTPLLYVAPIAALAVLLAFPATALATNALAVLPGRRAARIHPGEVLRIE